MRILHLEDSPADAYLVQRTLSRHGLSARIHCAKSAEEFRNALLGNSFDVIVVDNGLPGFDGKAALEFARTHRPDLPLIFCSGSAKPEDALAKLDLGATDYVLKEHLWQLVAALRRVHAPHVQPADVRERHARAMQRLVQVVQDLSFARNLEDVMEIVRHAARDLTGADGATFILRDRDQCHYAEEDAISPLWKGQRFPLTSCISGWSMLNRKAVVIEDIYADERIPHDLYRSTFVKSLAMVPIRTGDPLGAIGNYWATRHQPTDDEVHLLQTLANTVSVALENVQLYRDLERRVQDRTAELQQANDELETFSHAVSHDLGAPLRALGAELAELREHCGLAGDAVAQALVCSAQQHAQRMRQLVEDLMRLARASRVALQVQKVNLSAMVESSLASLLGGTSGVQQVVAPGISANADHGLLNVVLANLLSNAVKYSGKRARPRIEFIALAKQGEPTIYCVRDNGAGFDMRHADRLFTPFARLHGESEFPGNGIGLVTVRRAVERHGGRIWAEAAPDVGAAFYFTLAA